MREMEGSWSMVGIIIILKIMIANMDDLIVPL